MIKDNLNKRKIKFCFFGNMAAPYMVKMAACFTEVESKFYFYEWVKDSRPEWWRVALPSNVRILRAFSPFRNKYFSLKVFRALNDENPDVVVIGFFAIPANYFCYLWAKAKKKKVLLVSEIWRNKHGSPRTNFFLLAITQFLYRKLDGVMCIGEPAYNYFSHNLRFNGAKVIMGRYPADIDNFLQHPARATISEGRLIFPHRLTKEYNPIFAIDLVKDLLEAGRQVSLKLNGSGPLREQCESYIKSLDLSQSIVFIDTLESWDQLSQVYATSEICVSPCIYSNGNLSIVEAMASGCGVVISDKVQQNDVMIKESKGGFICSLMGEEFKEAVCKYLDEPGLITSHGERNKQRVREYAPAQTAAVWSRCILDLLE